MASGYNPFEKGISDIATGDLGLLREVPEGWYVDYKRDLISPEKIAKAFAAFANTYGGWLFIGIGESLTAPPVAANFIGIPAADVSKAMQQLRQAANQHVQPAPFFETVVLAGPCEDIGLAEGRSIIVVHVPRSLHTPHIHSSGRIYRRVADGSEEIEKDRHAIDQLQSRAKPLRRWHRKLIRNDPKFTKSERLVPYVRLIAMPDPWFDKERRHDFTPEKFRSVLNEPSSFGALMPFQTVSSSANDLIARQTEFNDPHALAVSWRLSFDLISDILLPLNAHYPADTEELARDFDGYETKDRFIDLLDRARFSTLRVVDLSFAFNGLSAVLYALNRLMTAADYQGEVRYKVRVLNAWRMTPFVDVPSVINHYETLGVPVCLDEHATMPEGFGPDSYALLNPPLPLEGEEEQQSAGYWHALGVFMSVAEALGIYRDALLDDEGTSVGRLRKAGENAMNVQRHRNALRGVKGP